MLLARKDIAAELLDDRGRTPLSYAAKSGHDALVILLLQRPDVVPDSQYIEGHTPKDYARMGRRHERVARRIEVAESALLSHL